MSVPEPITQRTVDSRGLASLPVGSVVVLARGSKRETVVITRHWALRARLALFELTSWSVVSARGPQPVMPPRRVPGLTRSSGWGA